jgi:hypothetical protein
MKTIRSESLDPNGLRDRKLVAYRRGAPALQAGGRGFESLKLHQTGDKLEKPS